MSFMLVDEIYLIIRCQFASSLSVAIAYRIVARTAPMSGVHFASSVADLPPR
jgi:hypothetical protein